MKRYLTILLTLAMALSLFAPLAGQAEALAPIKFSMSAIDAETTGVSAITGEPTPVYEWLKSKYNVDFEFWPLTWSNYVDQTRMWLASGSAPDIIFLDVAAVRYSEYVDWVDAELFRPYDLDQYPNLSANFDKMKLGTGAKFAIDDKLYAWPAIYDSAAFNFVAVPHYEYRVDWAKQTDLYKEDGTYTWEEWWALVKAVQELNPAESDETIGVIFRDAWAFPRQILRQYTKDAMAMTLDENGDYVWGMTLDSTKEGVKAVKQLYDDGLIWKDQVLAIPNSWSDNFYANKLFAVGTENLTYGGPRGAGTGYINANPGTTYENFVDVLAIATVESPVKGHLLATVEGDQWSQTAMNAATVTDEKAARWQSILDYLVSDEGYYTRNWGIPGVEWQYNANGEPEVIWGTNAEGALENPTNGFWWFARIGGTNDNLALYAPDGTKWIQKATIDAMNKYLVEPNEIVPIDVALRFYVDPVYSEITAGLEETIYQKFCELLPRADFQAQWDAWVEQEAAILQPAVDALNANLK
ncbi:hypothetical protein AGMMS49992_09770 [Clostridia bacterium]|nr:hypothetical protein AGMMS49992_09770 [Clostridia bacterium]